MNPYLLGIDLGTTAIKVGVFDLSGQAVALKQTPTPVYWDSADQAHHGAEELWQAVVGLLKQLEPYQLEPIAAIGVSSFGEAGTLVNAAGEAAVPVLAWFDARPKATFDQIEGQMLPQAWRAKVGLYPDYTYGLSKLVWLKRQYPELMGHTQWLPVADWIAFKLSGKLQIGPTQASRTGVLDLRTGGWLEPVLQSLGLSNVLPPVRTPGETIGWVTAEAAAQTGLKAGVPVMETGHDQTLAAVGVGADGAGTLVNSCGTAEVLFGVFGREQLEDALQNSKVTVGAHATKDRFYAMDSMRASGVTWDWLVRLASALHPATHEELIGLAQKVPAGSEGVRFLPYVRPQSANPLELQPSAGSFVGLLEHHGLGHLARAVLEGLSFETYRLFEAIRKATSNPIPPIRAVGGSTQNSLWMQTKATFMQTPIETYRSPHAAAWGAAWLAGHHLGLAEPIQLQVQSRLEPATPMAELLKGYHQALSTERKKSK